MRIAGFTPSDIALTGVVVSGLVLCLSVYLLVREIQKKESKLTNDSAGSDLTDIQRDLRIQESITVFPIIAMLTVVLKGFL